MRKVLSIFLVAALVAEICGCGNKEKNIESVSMEEFEINSEDLEKEGYENIADIAYAKIEESDGKPEVSLIYCKNIPDVSVYLMGQIMEELNYNENLSIIWDGKEYLFNDEYPPNDAKEDKIYLYFPDDWKETIEKVQEIGMDNIITKNASEAIDEAVEEFVEKYLDSIEDESEEVSSDTESRNGLSEYTESETLEEANVILEKKYEVDGEEIVFTLNEVDGRHNILASGYAKDEEKASIMFASLYGELKQLSTDGYSVTAKCEEKYVTVLNSSGDDNIMGINKDGSFTLSVPDWFVTDFKMPEDEVNSYSQDVLSALYKFGKELEEIK